jgi:hypothetical protein
MQVIDSLKPHLHLLLEKTKVIPVSVIIEKHNRAQLTNPETENLSFSSSSND